VSAAALVGCGVKTDNDPKLTAAEAARALGRRASVPLEASCVAGEAPFGAWDYKCTYLDDGDTVGINVDDKGITGYSG
jgi:hypothetical protein